VTTLPEPAAIAKPLVCVDVALSIGKGRAGVRSTWTSTRSPSIARTAPSGSSRGAASSPLTRCVFQFADELRRPEVESSYESKWREGRKRRPGGDSRPPTVASTRPPVALWRSVVHRKSPRRRD
jgi:hypothetical protein